MLSPVLKRRRAIVPNRVPITGRRGGPGGQDMMSGFNVRQRTDMALRCAQDSAQLGRFWV